jgi:guanylate kinase
MEKRPTIETKEKHPNIGMLIVITGRSGAGKDAVMDKLLEHNIINSLSINRVITCTDRPIRDGEPPDAYHFLKPTDLDTMAECNKLVEEITITGTSRKATSKSEIARLLSGENLLWRIDPSRAAEVSTGNFFEKHFPENAQVLKERTLVVCINAPKRVIESRRKGREGKNYKPEEFELRDKQDAPHIDILLKKAVVIENHDGQLSETTETVAQLIYKHHDKIKSKKI